MRRTLVAGLGNIFLGDDAFGVEVVRRLAGRSLPAGTRVLDVGLRTTHLAYLVAEGLDLLLLVDAIDGAGPPGTLYLVEPRLDQLPGATLGGAHSLDVGSLFARARSLGASLPPVRLVGCQPLTVEEGIGLSPPVEGAVPGAIEMVITLLNQNAREEGP